MANDPFESLLAGALGSLAEGYVGDMFNKKRQKRDWANTAAVTEEDRKYKTGQTQALLDNWRRTRGTRLPEMEGIPSAELPPGLNSYFPDQGIPGQGQMGGLNGALMGNVGAGGNAGVPGTVQKGWEKYGNAAGDYLGGAGMENMDADRYGSLVASLLSSMVDQSGAEGREPSPEDKQIDRQLRLLDIQARRLPGAAGDRPYVQRLDENLGMKLFPDVPYLDPPSGPRGVPPVPGGIFGWGRKKTVAKKKPGAAQGR